MKRSICLILCAVLLVVLPLGVGCAPKRLDHIENLHEQLQDHGHSVVPYLGKRSLGLLVFSYVIAALMGDFNGGTAPALESESLAPDGDPTEWVAPYSRPTLDRFLPGGSPSAASPFFDHDLDGAWHGRTFLSFDGGFAKLPFVLVANASHDGWVYVSIVFQDILECMDSGQSEWTAVYTDKVDIDPRSGRLHFEKVASSFLAPFVPNIAMLDFSYTATVSRDGFLGAGKASLPGRSKSVFTTIDEFLKMKKTRGVHDLWSSGFTERIWIGEYLEPPLFHPILISLMDRPTGLDMDLFVLFGFEEAITSAVDGNRLTFEFSADSGLVDGDLTLQGKRLTGRIWDPLSSSYRELTFVPAGTNGKTPKVKRVKPKTAALSTPGKTATLTVIGKDFAPGSMVFFDHSDIELESVEFLSKKKLRVKIASATGIAAGTTVDVMVLNSDNRSAERARAFRTR